MAIVGKSDVGLDVYVLQQHLEDLWQFSRVCVLKFILTEGEKIVIFYFTSGTD